MKNEIEVMANNQITNEEQLIFFENQIEQQRRNIGLSFIEIGKILKQVKSDKLFILRSCETMKEYIEKHIAGFSYRHCLNMIKVAEKFDSIDNNILNHFNVTELLDASSDDDLVEDIKAGYIEFQDGKKQDATEYVKKMKAKIKRVEKKVDKEVSKKDKIITEKEKQYKLEIKELQDKLEHQKTILENVAKTQKMNPNRLAIIANTSEAGNLIDEKVVGLSEFLNPIYQIDENIQQSPELANKMFVFISVLEKSFKELKELWSSHLYSLSEKEINERIEDAEFEEAE